MYISVCKTCIQSLNETVETGKKKKNSRRRRRKDRRTYVSFLGLRHPVVQLHVPPQLALQLPPLGRGDLEAPAPLLLVVMAAVQRGDVHSQIGGALGGQRSLLLLLKTAQLIFRSHRVLKLQYSGYCGGGTATVRIVLRCAESDVHSQIRTALLARARFFSL